MRPSFSARILATADDVDHVSYFDTGIEDDDLD
ncbi:hypothetical protein FB463_002788 [Frigoribacterium faeni]|uniref:Uncharacterized protein n=1 Tax=Frigoribacterium faeni TaxID=145483 RepID=A0A7W3PJJ3_9MICO|nr:hypothetical protein [Frigoribacterium faeni]